MGLSGKFGAFIAFATVWILFYFAWAMFANKRDR